MYADIKLQAYKGGLRMFRGTFCISLFLYCQIVLWTITAFFFTVWNRVIGIFQSSHIKEPIPETTEPIKKIYFNIIFL